MDTPPFWRVSTETWIGKLGGTMSGLAGTDAAARLVRYGRNADIRTVQAGLLVAIIRRLLEPMSLLLIVAVIVSTATGDRASAVIIAIILAASVVLDTLQEGRAKHAAEALRQSVALTAEVMRDGKLSSVDVETVVPGDVFRVTVGDIIPADAMVLKSDAFTANEAALTGEPYGVAKHPGEVTANTAAGASNALFRGSVAQSGTADAFAIGTGPDTLFGKAALSLNAAPEISPFQRELRQLGLLVARATIVLAFAVLAANILFGRPLIQSLMFSVALAVGLTPELLPMITTVTLSRGAMRMSRKSVIVKRLSAIHDLGAMTVLCTDKTGTLTSAEITLESSIGPNGEPDARPANLAAICAILGGDKGSLDAALAKNADATKGWTRHRQLPFDYRRRIGAVLADGPEGLRLIVKGAPDAVISLCLPAAGGAMSAAAHSAALVSVGRFAADGIRAVAIASRPWSGASHDLVLADAADLTFEGLCTFSDPPKASAPAAIKRLTAAGVRVVIVSGDDPLVVAHLAKLVGLPAQRIITGAQMTALSTAALRVQVRNTDIFARLAPEQKVHVVEALRWNGDIIGFMGDGVNDAPGLKAADVALSVAGATAVARAAADMILLQADLAVVADGIEEGRRTFANIMKYLRMGTSSNFGNMFSMAAASLFLPFLPMLATQILLNNLLYDLSEIGIPFDDVWPDDLVQPPRWNLPDIVRFAGIMGPVSSVFDLATFAVLYLGFHANAAAFRTGWFLESIVTQTLVVFLIRTRGRPWRDLPNPKLAASTLGALLVALIVPFSPLAEWFGFAVPTLREAAVLGVIAIFYLICVEVIKPYAMRAAYVAAARHTERRAPRHQRKATA